MLRNGRETKWLLPILSHSLNIRLEGLKNSRKSSINIVGLRLRFEPGTSRKKYALSLYQSAQCYDVMQVISVFSDKLYLYVSNIFIQFGLGNTT
jgi:hypothetical protein